MSGPVISRREALRLGAAGVLVGGPRPKDTGGGEAPAAPPPSWAPQTPLDDALFPLGVQVGDPAPSSAICWSRITSSAAPELVVVRWDGAAWQEVSRTDHTPDAGGFLHVVLDGLDPNTWYSFAFESGGSRSSTGRWQSPAASGTSRLVFGGSACTKHSYVPFPVLSQAAALDLSFFLLAGDQVYADGAATLEEYRAFWTTNLSSAGYRDLLSSTAVVATWDDHEVTNDWGTVPATSDQEAFGMQAFFEHTPCTPRLGEATWRTLSFGDTLDLHVLDCRSERDPEGGLYISEAQLEWLVESMRGSGAVFQGVLNSVPMVDLEPLVGSLRVEDRWQGFPEQRSRLVEAIGSVPNVYFLTGDFHTGLVARVDAEGPGHGMFDILMGAAGNRMNPMGGMLEPTDQFLAGTAERNVVRFEMDPADETVVVEYVGEEGQTLEAIRLPDGEFV